LLTNKKSPLRLLACDERLSRICHIVCDEVNKKNGFITSTRDGRTQIVTYSVGDEHTGFVANVRYEGTAIPYEPVRPVPGPYGPSPIIPPPVPVPTPYGAAPVAPIPPPVPAPFAPGPAVPLAARRYA